MSVDVTFPKSDLRSLAYGDNLPGYTPVLDEVVSTGRWSIDHRQVFIYDGLYYETFYSEGATENQDEEPYEYTSREVEPGRIKVTPVRAVERKVTVYEPVIADE